MGATTERSDGRLFALSETMRAFAEATVDLQRLVRIVAERVAQLIGDGCSLVLLSDDQQRLSVAAVHFRDPAQTALAQRVLGDKTMALEAVRDDPSRFDLAITDFNMPGISGIQVAKLLGMIRPDLPVILSSGNISDDLRESASRAGVAHVLHKPSTAEELAEAVHRCLV